VRALRAQDGVSVPVPDFGPLYARKLRTVGRCLLLQEDTREGKAVRLYDVQTAQDTWRREFATGAIVMRGEDPGLLGVVEKDRTVTVLKTNTGEVLFKSLLQAEHSDRLQDVALVSDREHIYLALNRTPEPGLNWSPNAMSGLRTLKINGPLYALNRRSGKLEWVCDFLPHQALMLEQVRDLPILLFASQYNKMAANGSPERQGVKVTGVDKRTGKLVYDKEFAPNNQFHALRADPLAGTIELIRTDLKIAFRLDGTAAARAGSPPAPGVRQLRASAPVSGVINPPPP